MIVVFDKQKRIITNFLLFFANLPIHIFLLL